MRSHPLLLLVLLVAAATGAADVAAQGRPAADSGRWTDAASPFRPLDLPTPNTYRTAAGRPGAQYWQQRADYRIEATLDTTRQEIRGRETIRYHNNSPDALPYLWLHVEQNICAPTSVTAQLDQPPLVFLGSTFDFSCKGFQGGGTVESLRAGGRDLARTAYGTTMRVDLAEPLAPGGMIELEIVWRFRVPPYGAGRMGRDGSLYEIAQWYPRVAVYDDVRGWNHEPYIGAGEFYLEYGSYDVALTVPAGFVVGASGVLQNPETVLNAERRERLGRAARSESPVAVITADEARRAATRRSDGMATWRFTADSVRDFAWAASPAFQWDASGWSPDTAAGRAILVHTLYRPSATLWREANRMVRDALHYYSEQWMPYPYPHITSVEGPIEGMEYPMLTFDPAGPSREELHWVLTHELGHMWVPMVVGSNERLYPWMDEGFNTFIDLGNAAGYFKGTAYGDTIEVHPLRLYPEHAAAGREQALILRPVEALDLFWTGYQKPALMMQLLRHEVLGRERFDRAFRDYLRTWAFKHPTPADFIRLMRDASGMDLDWFWRGWIYGTARLDQAVESVTADSAGVTRVQLVNRGDMVMPAELELTFAGGETERVRLPVEMWNLGPRFTYRVRGRRPTRVTLDPRHALPDTDRANNSWPR